VSFVAVLNSSFLKKSIALILSSIFSLNSLTASGYLGENDRVNAATPPRMERIQQPSDRVSPVPKVADVCIFGICAPVNLPKPVEGIVNPLLDNVVKDKIRSLLADEIPINGSKHNFYKNLSTLPGNTFKPSTLYLTALSPNRQIPAGDYQIPVHFYCTGIYTFNGRGNRFALAQLNGRMADVLSALYTRASYQKQIPISDIQSLAWSIQSGIAYNELSPGHKLLVTQLIPEYRDRMERGFIERLEGISGQVSQLSGGRIPNLHGILNQLGPVGDIAQTALRARQEILRTNFKAQALAERFSPQRDFFLEGGTNKTPWSQVQNSVYMRFIAPSGAMRDGVVDVRVPNGRSVSSRTLLAEITKSVGVSEGSGGQGIQATVIPAPKDAKNPPLPDKKEEICQEPIRNSDRGANIQLGIDRWWGTIGQTKSMPVTWTVNVTKKDKYNLYISIESVDKWGFKANSTVKVGNEKSVAIKISKLSNKDLKYVANIGCLDAGIHFLTINSFKAPNKPLVDKIKFELSGDNGNKQNLTTLFVADNPELVRSSYKVEGVNKSLSRNELIDRFAPTLYFMKRDSVQFPYDASTMYRSKLVKNIKNNSSVARGDSETYLQGVGELPYPSSGAKAYASISEKDVVVVRNKVVVVRNKNGGRDRFRELAINYYFFYPISDWRRHGGSNTHEGDWEGVTLFLKEVGDRWVPNRVAYAQHLKAKVIPWNQVSLENISHPKVFVGVGGHASYPNSGIEDVITLIGTLPEDHRGENIPVSLTGKIEYLPHVSQLNSKHWLLYSGYWGRKNLDGGVNPYDGDSAPRGPLYLDTTYSYKESSGRGVRWLDPWAWSR
jgi:hypothetical protein